MRDHGFSAYDIVGPRLLFQPVRRHIDVQRRSLSHRTPFGLAPLPHRAVLHGVLYH